MGLAHSPRIVTNGLVLCLDAGNTKSYPGSGTTWTDLSVNTLNGTLFSSPTFSSGNFTFNGTSQYVTAAHNSLFSPGANGFSVEMILNPSVAADTRLFTKGASGNGNLEYTIGWNGTNPYIYTSTTGSNFNLLTSTGSFSINQWTHFTLTKSGTTANFYINGSLSSSGTVDGTLYQSTGNIAIGVAGALNSLFLNGKMSTVRYYNRTLSSAEVLQNFNALRGRFGL